MEGKSKYYGDEFERKIREFFTPKVVSISFFLVSFYFYSTTCYRQLAPGMSLDFMLASYEFGVPHAPGYPLLTLIGHIWSYLPLHWFGITYSFQMNILISIISSLANILMFFIVKFLTGKDAAGVYALFKLGFTSNIWENAINYESEPLNNLLILMITYAYLRQVEARNEKDISDRKLANMNRLIFGLCGLALTNQHQSIFIVLPIVCEIWFHEITSYRNFDSRNLVIWLGTPLLLYLNLLIAANLSNTHWKWGHCDTFVGWLRHILQMDYGSSIFAPKGIYKSGKQSVITYGYAAKDFLHLMFHNFGIIGLIIFAAGNLRAYFDKRLKFLWVLLAVNVIIFAKFVHTHQYKNSVLNRLWIQPSLVYIIFLGIGFGTLLDLWNNNLLKHAKIVSDTIKRAHEDVGEVVCTIILFFILFVQACSQVYLYDHSRTFMLDYHVRTTMEMMPKNALVFGMDDRLGFSIPFLQITENYRKDLDFVHQDLFIHNYWKKNKSRHLKVKFPLTEYGADMYQKETNNTKYQEDVLEFVRANQQRQIFFCQTQEKRPFDFLHKEEDIEILPWSHCDQVFVKTNTTMKFAVHSDSFFVDRHNELMKLMKPWGFLPPHLSFIPKHAYEYNLNKIMWAEKNRLGKLALEFGMLEFGRNRTKSLNFVQQAGEIYFDVMKRTLKMSQTTDKRAFIPPEWFKDLATVHLRLADYGGPENFDSFKKSRELMEFYIRYSQIHKQKYKHWEEVKNIRALDNVLYYNGTKTFSEAQILQKPHPQANKKLSRTPGGVSDDMKQYRPHPGRAGPPPPHGQVNPPGQPVKHGSQIHQP